MQQHCNRVLNYLFRMFILLILGCYLYRDFRISSRHPLDQEFLKIIKKHRMRQKSATDCKEVSLKTWMELSDGKGGTVYHNFADGTSSNAPPSTSVILDSLHQMQVSTIGCSLSIDDSMERFRNMDFQSVMPMSTPNICRHIQKCQNWSTGEGQYPVNQETSKKCVAYALRPGGQRTKRMLIWIKQTMSGRCRMIPTLSLDKFPNIRCRYIWLGTGRRWTKEKVHKDRVWAAYQTVPCNNNIRQRQGWTPRLDSCQSKEWNCTGIMGSTCWSQTWYSRKAGNRDSCKYDCKHRSMTCNGPDCSGPSFPSHVSTHRFLVVPKVTLMQASIETSLWIDHHKTKLLRLKKEVLDICKKYKYRPFDNSIVYTRDCGLPGGVSLRSLMDQISRVIKVISQFRPGLGESANGLRTTDSHRCLLYDRQQQSYFHIRRNETPCPCACPARKYQCQLAAFQWGSGQRPAILSCWINPLVIENWIQISGGWVCE